ncbi:AMP-binding protein [Novosphingobium sp. JCM 18896]|uniref:AMP-binding protein n=1 Tax=Novosphingobium sp. JCM 18896 TaxID=2989731 RepID=UPI00222330A4|nr:AMP-binding protein [Novosphingobium sp. JCM 18896]MCW1432279.1 AMP-binding protein [Novosphingobium sp. JCM 18896]
MNVYSLLDQAAIRHAQAGAVYCDETLVATFDELRHRSLQLASRFGRMGKPGDRVLVAAKNRPELVEIMFAIWAAGMVAVPVNAKLHPREIADVVEDSSPIVIMASTSIAQNLAPLAQRTPMIEIGSRDYTALFTGEASEPAEVAPEDVAWLFYTSGTTGRSKGAMLTHRNLMAMSVAHLADFDDVGHDSSLIHSAPMSHGSGLYMLPYIARGARQVVPGAGVFEPANFLRLCDVHPRVAAFLAPTMLQRVRIVCEAAGRVPANLHLIVYGGGPMYLSELRQSLATFGQAFAQLYGQGEAPMTITGLRRSDHATEDDAILGSVGWPRTGVEVKVVDRNGKALPAGTIGEIVCRGDVVMAGYWNNPEATAQALRGGWLHTGDLGSFDERGCLTLRDRSKDVIISGGTNIYPREVEEALLAHPDVAEVAVVGEADPEWGENVVAYVVPVPGKKLGADALDAHCLSSIARFKRPKSYRFLRELPKNSNGKVLKRALLSEAD